MLAGRHCAGCCQFREGIVITMTKHAGAKPLCPDCVAFSDARGWLRS